MADALPALAEPLRSIIDRLVDLLQVVRNHVYHPDFGGSFSLKSVLPALVPELDYKTIGSRSCSGWPFGNEGRREARNWRVRFATTSVATTIALDQQRDGRRITQTLVGSGWQYEVHAAGPADTVAPGMVVYILGRAHTPSTSRADSMSSW